MQNEELSNSELKAKLCALRRRRILLEKIGEEQDAIIDAHKDAVVRSFNLILRHFRMKEITVYEEVELAFSHKLRMGVMYLGEVLIRTNEANVIAVINQTIADVAIPDPITFVAYVATTVDHMHANNELDGGE